ncbi:hypothetical protein BC629DRAFT_1438693 [Irpex lacteus]|nr:hypothetical protein BC629DRAFT_1438693 [Irpex lacteus]
MTTSQAMIIPPSLSSFSVRLVTHLPQQTGSLAIYHNKEKAGKCSWSIYYRQDSIRCNAVSGGSQGTLRSGGDVRYEAACTRRAWLKKSSVLAISFSQPLYLPIIMSMILLEANNARLGELEHNDKALRDIE